MKKLSTLIAIACFSTFNISHAAVKFDWSDCKAETQKYCPQEKGNEPIYNCLKQGGYAISATCAQTITKYEVATEKKTGQK